MRGQIFRITSSRRIFHARENIVFPSRSPISTFGKSTFTRTKKSGKLEERKEIAKKAGKYRIIEFTCALTADRCICETRRSNFFIDMSSWKEKNSPFLYNNIMLLWESYFAMSTKFLIEINVTRAIYIHGVFPILNALALSFVGVNPDVYLSVWIFFVYKK